MLVADRFSGKPQEQAPSRKRARSSAHVRDTPVAATPLNAAYHQSSLPSLAPAQSHSPTASHDPAMLTSSFRVSSTGVPAGFNPQQLADRPHAFAHVTQGPVSQADGSVSPAILAAGPTLAGPPVRPAPPYDQFIAHMTPQLVEDNYPQDQMAGKIKELWEGMTAGERGLWDQRYRDQMVDYETAMDGWKREERKRNSGGFGAVNR